MGTVVEARKQRLLKCVANLSSTKRENGYPCNWCTKTMNSNTLQNTPEYGLQYCSEMCFSKSRRDSFKKARKCDWCKLMRPTINYNGIQDNSLQFCSNKCLTYYKMELFRNETQEYLDSNPHLKDNNTESIDYLITPELWFNSSDSKPLAVTTVKSLPKLNKHDLTKKSQPLIKIKNIDNLLDENSLMFANKESSKKINVKSKNRTVVLPEPMQIENPVETSNFKNRPEDLKESDINNSKTPIYNNSLNLPITIMVPYPILIPLPIPVPIPISKFYDLYEKSAPTENEEKTPEINKIPKLKICRIQHNQMKLRKRKKYCENDKINQ